MCHVIYCFDSPGLYHKLIFLHRRRFARWQPGALWETWWVTIDFEILMKVIGAIAQWSVLGLIRGSEKILFENIKYFYLLTEKKFKSSGCSFGCREGLMSFWTPSVSQCAMQEQSNKWETIFCSIQPSSSQACQPFQSVEQLISFGIFYFLTPTLMNKYFPMNRV